MKNTRVYCAISAVLFLILNVCANNGPMRKNFLTADNGLSHNEVTSIIQDNDGFIWIGTRGGLNRYDGYEFKIFNQVPMDSNSLVNPSIERLFNDSKGNIWIGTKSGGISKYTPSTNTFSNFVNNYHQADTILPIRRALAFFEDHKGRIWVGSRNKGLYIYDEEHGEAQHYLADLNINSIVGTSDHRVFVCALGSKGNGLFEFLPKANRFVKRLDIPCRKLVYDEPRNLLWIVGGDNIGAAKFNSGLTRMDLRNGKTKVYRIENSGLNHPKLPHSYFSLHLDGDGKLWIGTWGTGLYLFDPDQQKFERYYIYPERQLNSNRDYDAVLDIFEDKDENIWLGTNGGGVCMLSPKLGFNAIGFSPNANKGLINTRVMSVLEDREGGLWIGTIGNGLMWTRDRKKYQTVANPSLEIKSRFFVIKYLYQDADGTIWVGSNLGCYVIKFLKGEPVLVSAVAKYNNPVFEFTAVSILEAANMLWIGTLQNGLFLLDHKTFKVVKSFNLDWQNSSSLQSNRISCLFQDSKDRIWLGTYNGLHVYNKEDSTIQLAEAAFDIKGNFTGNIVTCIEEDKKGNLWVGMPNGLNVLSQNNNAAYQIDHFTDKDGIASNFIKGIACDQKGNIWFSTGKGISKYVHASSSFINFDERDGVLGRDFIEASVFRGMHGEMYFGGTSGVTLFNPKEIQKYPVAKSPVFTSLKVLNKEVEVGRAYNTSVILDTAIFRTKSIVLAHNQNKVQVGFSAFDFTSMGRNGYQVKLENVDDAWNDIGDRNFVVFNNLSPGQYVLKVKSSNRHKVWNQEPASLRITINSPFWQTWYAIIFYVLVVLGIVTIIRRNSMKQVRLANNLELEKIQREQSVQINEMKLRFFTNISHEFRTPLTLILAPLREMMGNKEKYKMSTSVEDKLMTVQQNSQRLLKLVDQLLDFRKVETGNMKLMARETDFEQFVVEVCSPFHELATINNISLNFSSSIKDKQLWVDADKFEIILNNLISNAFKSVSENGDVSVSIYEEEDSVLLSVADNGPGIPQHELNHIFERFYNVGKSSSYKSSGIGLALTKRMVELHHGNIHLSSEPNVHTEFVVTLPKGNAHLKPEEMSTETGPVKSFLRFESETKSHIKSSRLKKTKGKLQVLLVEDHAEVRDYLEGLLEEYYKVDSAENGREALAMVDKQIPDLIISDFMMPVMDGIEFCKQLKANKKTSIVPFIFLSARKDEQYLMMAEKIGVSDFISKPFNPEILLQKIKNILARQKELKQRYSKAVHLAPSEVEITSGEEEFISLVISVIERNFQNEEFTSEVLAAQLNRSYSSLYRKLKALTGYSTAEFVRSIRIKRAAQLLADKKRAISDIAFSVGFHDVKHFRAVFQKQYNCSPSKYREGLS